MYTHIIWDWNGTLLDDVSGCRVCINIMLSKRGLKTLDSVESYHKIFGFPIRDYYVRAGFDFSKESFEEVAVEYMELYMARQYPLHIGAPEVLRRIKDRGLRQIILSASRVDYLRQQVNQFDIARYLDEVLGISDIYGESKVEIGREYIARQTIGRAVLVGDSLHDYEVATEIGADCILIANGHQSAARLAQSGAPVLTDISQVAQMLFGAGKEENTR
jgi:phosphoglycolate phosphatase